MSSDFEIELKLMTQNLSNFWKAINRTFSRQYKYCDLIFFQRTGPADIYGSTKPQSKHPIADRGGGVGSAEYRGNIGGVADELMNDFSDNDETPLTEPIYNGR